MAQPSWAVLDKSNFHYEFRVSKVKAEYEMWRSAQPIRDVRSHEDWTTLSSVLRSQLGEPKHRQARFLDALDCLDRLPRLRAFVEDSWLLDMEQLSFIERAVCEAPIAIQDDDFFWKALDEDLMERFTPSRPRQLTPTNSTIKATVIGTIRSVEHLAIPDSHPLGNKPVEGPATCENPGELMSTLPPVEEETSSLIMQDLPGGNVRFDLSVGQAAGTQIADAVMQVANEQNCSQAEALSGLILGNISTQVTTLVYAAKDVEDAPVYHPERGLLSAEAAATLQELVTKTLDMDEAADAATCAYETTDLIRAYLFGRDWTCRWPGCSRKATHCDADHRINHADGGPTTAANMIMLCRHHHNRKTDRQAFYLLDHHTGDVYWLFADGTYVVDAATGPLAPKQKRWVQTFSQRRLRLRERLAAQAAAERFENYQHRINSPPEPRRYLPWRRERDPDGLTVEV
ncbi:HNH endonuclease signature motif containing protein [Corynebacterium nasicanis]|uniref:HNH endonuclease signature motif containing protein n=1 Tax=Corynebacterium nasicanis TaxID=1448267 RepID=A0ABW1QDM2_9CORY